MNVLLQYLSLLEALTIRSLYEWPTWLMIGALVSALARNPRWYWPLVIGGLFAAIHVTILYNDWIALGGMGMAIQSGLLITLTKLVVAYAVYLAALIVRVVGRTLA
jgi:hypothetical protein